MFLDDKPLLQGIRVLDASRVLAGPYCGQVLGDLGAEVIKVEKPGTGDETRAWGPPFVGELSAYFLSCNRNKKAISLDLNRTEGRELFHRLVQKSDVLLENFLPETLRKLGLARETLWELNPRLIVGSITGFGKTGPWANRPGYDFAIQGLSGLMSVTGPVQGEPTKVGVAITDVLTGLYLATAVLACLHARKETGHGYAIDLALLDCAVASQVNLAQTFLSTQKIPPRQGNAHLQIVPYQTFQASNDWLILAVGNDDQWQRFCLAVGRTDWANDPRFRENQGRVRHREILVPEISELFRTGDRDAWLTLLEKAEIPCAPVLNYAEVFSLEQIAARGMKIKIQDREGHDVDLLGSPFHIKGAKKASVTPPPTVGEHSEQILREILELSESKISELRASRVIE